MAKLNVVEQDQSVSVGFSNGQLLCTIPSSYSSSKTLKINTRKDYVSGMSELAQTILSTETLAKSVFLPWIPAIPIDVLASIREFMMGHQIHTFGADYAIERMSSGPRIVQMSADRSRIIQTHYKGGPLDGKPIPKYGWYEDKFFHAELNSDRFVFGKLNVISCGKRKLSRPG